MEGKASVYSFLTVARWLGPFVCLLVWVSPAFSIGEVYPEPPVESLQGKRRKAPCVSDGMNVPDRLQPCGVTSRLRPPMSVVDNTPPGKAKGVNPWYGVYQWTDPSGVINFSDNLDSVPEALRESPQLIVRRDLFVHETPVDPAGQQAYPQESRFDPIAPPSHPIEFNPTIIYSPQTTTNIVVVNSGIRRVRRRPFPVHRPHGLSFGRKFKGRHYIHSEAHSGRRRQYIHPEAYRQPRLSHRGGFAGRRHHHKRAITGRRR